MGTNAKGRSPFMLFVTVALVVLLAAALYFTRGDEPQESTMGESVDESLSPATSQAERELSLEELEAERREKILAAVQRLRAKAAQQGADPEALMATLLNQDLPLAQRIQALWALVRSGDREASLSALMKILEGDEDDVLKAQALHAIGGVAGPEVRGLLEEQLGAESMVLWVGAMRGLAMLKDPQDFTLFVNYLRDDGLPMDIRAEAAKLLAVIDPSKASSELVSAFSEVVSNELASEILDAIGTLPFSETKAFYASLLDDGSLSSELRIRAIESLAAAEGDASDLLLGLAAESSDPDEREAAAASLGEMDLGPSDIPALVELLGGESSPEVRGEIWRDLALNSDDLDYETVANDLIPQLQNETGLLAQLEGSRVPATLIRNGEKGLIPVFDKKIVPMLRKIVDSCSSSYECLYPMDTMFLAGTPGSIEELKRLANHPSPDIAEPAQKYLDRF